MNVKTDGLEGPIMHVKAEWLEGPVELVHVKTK